MDDDLSWEAPNVLFINKQLFRNLTEYWFDDEAIDLLSYLNSIEYNKLVIHINKLIYNYNRTDIDSIESDVLKTRIAGLIFLRKGFVKWFLERDIVTSKDISKRNKLNFPLINLKKPKMAKSYS